MSCPGSRRKVAMPYHRLDVAFMPSGYFALILQHKQKLEKPEGGGNGQF